MNPKIWVLLYPTARVYFSRRLRDGAGTTNSMPLRTSRNCSGVPP